ncbi:hypothetical protein RRG08_044585 [Elysia crispata]|uniref:Uncharacterized protein n=1 Tax=Elysia crispata TaxID=231223 RepID=A0AAE0ZTV7_9GAST|nr:hypothetical protein RRG08_044585 [Elysia crispata]
MRSTPREELTIFASPSYFRVGGSQCRVTRMVSFSSSSILKEKFGSLLTPSFPWRFGGPTVYHLYGSSNRHTCKVVGATPAMAATSLAMVACAARIAPGPHVLITIYPSGNKLGVVGSKSRFPLTAAQVNLDLNITASDFRYKFRLRTGGALMPGAIVWEIDATIVTDSTVFISKVQDTLQGKSRLPDFRHSRPSDHIALLFTATDLDMVHTGC